MSKIKCPKCRKTLDEKQEELEPDDIVYCSACAAEFEVIDIGPVRLRRFEDADGYGGDGRDEEEKMFAYNDDDDATEDV